MKQKKYRKFIITAAIAIVLVAIIAIILAKCFFIKKETNGNFELDTLLLKVSMVKDGTASNNIKVTNTGESQAHFSIKLAGIEDLASLDEKEFDLPQKGSRSFKINFNVEGIKPGVYLGELEISSVEKKTIPIIAEIQSKEVLFDSQINIFPPGETIKAGEIINAEIKIFDLSNIGVSDINSIYLIKDFKDGTIISETDRVVVDSKLGITKTIELSENMAAGEYVLINVVEYDGSVGTSSVLFKVAEKEDTSIFSAKPSAYIIILIIILSLVFFALFIYLIFYRDKMLKELQNQYGREISRQNDLIRKHEKIDYAKLRTSFEKREYKKAIQNIKEKRMRVLREIHKKRIERYKKIKNTGKKDKLKRQFSQWRERGYDTSVLETKYKLPKIHEIKNKIKKWKAKGYDTRVLEKKLQGN